MGSGLRRVWESSAAASVAFLCGGFSIDANAIAVEATTVLVRCILYSCIGVCFGM